jgi:Mg2+ and Co2+ transporter CorA
MGAADVQSGVSSDGRSTVEMPSDGDGVRLWLYDREGEDSPVDLASLPELDDSRLLWADVELESVGELAPLWEHLGIGDLVSDFKDLGRAGGLPALDHHGDVLHLTVIGVGDGTPECDPTPLHCLIGSNWAVTLHTGELDLIDEFNKPFHGETHLGNLDGPRFVSVVVDWQLSGYFGAIEGLRDDIDVLDEALLNRQPDNRDLLNEIVSLRRRVQDLRSALSPHRAVLALLSHPDSDSVVGTEAAFAYLRLEERVQRALEEVDTAQQMVGGSFDIFMTRTAQATNDIMKRLTIISVLLLPAVVIAGIMGMNFQVGMFEHSWLFWVVIVVMVALAGATLVIAKRRRWI